MSPIDPVSLVGTLATLGQLLKNRVSDVEVQRAVLSEIARAVPRRFGGDAHFVETNVLGRNDVAQLLLAPSSPKRLHDLKAWFRDLFVEQSDHVTGQGVHLDERVTAFVRDVDDILLQHGFHEAQVLGQKIETTHADTIKEIKASAKRVTKQQQENVDQILHAMRDSDTNINSQFRVLRDIAKRGRVEVATEEARRLRGDLHEDASVELRARFGRFIGTNLLLLYQTEQAVEELERALTENPYDIDLKLNTAGANLLTGNYARTRDLAQEALDSNKPGEAIGLLLQATYWLEGMVAVEKLVQEHAIGDNAAAALGFALILQQEGRFEEAEALLRPHLPNTVQTLNDAQVYSELAGALAGKVLHTLKAEQSLPWQHPAEITAILEEIEILLTATITYLEKTDYRKHLARDLANRGVVRSLHWHDDRALEDYRRSLEIAPDLLQSRINLARCHLVRDEYEIAAKLLLDIPKADRTYEVHRLIGEALHFGKRSHEAIPFLEAASEKAVGYDELTPVLAVLLDAYVNLGNDNATVELDMRLETEAPNDPHALSIRAQAAFAQNNYEKMVALYERALAQPGNHSAVRLDYANHLFRLERWEEAADQFAEVVTPDAFEAATRHYAMALFNAGRRKEALEFSQTVRERHGVRLGVTEVEARVLQELGDIEISLPLWRAMHELEPGNQVLKLSLVEALVLARDFDQARDITRDIDWRRLKPHAEKVMRVAQLRRMLGLADALELAWEALRLTPNNPDIHRHFTSLAMFADDNELPPELGEVVSNSVVVLERPDGTTFLVSILEGRDDLREREWTPGSPQAQRLLGKVVGEEVEWGDQLLEQKTVKVQAVLPPLLHAVRTSLSEFAERFPDHPGPVMFRGESPQETMETLIRVLSEMQESRRPLVEEYLREERIPIHFLAGKVLGLPIHRIRVWARVAPDRILHAFHGRARQLYRQRVRVQRAKQVVIDDSALLTLAELGLLDTLTERFEEILVPTSLTLELDQLIVQETGKPEPANLPSDLLLVQQIRVWLLQHATRVPVYSRLNLAPEVLTHTDDILGSAIADALYLAHSCGAPLFTDDLGLNLMAEDEWQVRATNTLQHLEPSVPEWWLPVFPWSFMSRGQN